MKLQMKLKIIGILAGVISLIIIFSGKKNWIIILQEPDPYNQVKNFVYLGIFGCFMIFTMGYTIILSKKQKNQSIGVKP